MSRRIPVHKTPDTIAPDRYPRINHKIYRTKRWAILRRMKLNDEPLCHCGCGEPATEVHHIVDVNIQPELAYDMTNMVCYAKQCHSRITRRRV